MSVIFAFVNLKTEQTLLCLFFVDDDNADDDVHFYRDDDVSIE